MEYLIQIYLSAVKKSPPTDGQVQRFFRSVDMFLQEKRNDKIIGLHCTHGVNKSAYMVCRYMIQIMKIPPAEAKLRIESARGHNMEKAFLINDLMEASWIHEDFNQTVRDVNRPQTARDVNRPQYTSRADASINWRAK